MDWEKLALEILTGDELDRFTELRAEAVAARGAAHAAAEQARRDAIDAANDRYFRLMRRAALSGIKLMIDREAENAETTSRD